METKIFYMGDRAELVQLIEQAVQRAMVAQKPNEYQKKYRSADEAWQYLNLPSKGSLYQLTCKKQITSIKKGKRLTFLQEDLDKYLMEGRRKATIDQ